GRKITEVRHLRRDRKRREASKCQSNVRKQRHRSEECPGKDEKSAQGSTQRKQNPIPPKPAGIRLEAAERIVLENDDARKCGEGCTDREHPQERAQLCRRH